MSEGIPEGWQTTSIGKLTKADSLFSDGDWVESKDQDPEGKNRLIQLADIGDGRFLNKSARFMNDEQFTRLRCTPLRQRDVLIARMPDPLGRACIFPGLNQQCATVVDVAIIRTEHADHYWLMSAINSSQFRRQIEINASGTTRTRISRGPLSGIRLIAPPKPEQHKIASILTSVDEVIEKTEAQISKLQDLKTGMMQELLTKGIGHTEFKPIPKWRVGKFPELKFMPAEWELADILSVAKLESGHTPSRNNPEYWNGSVQWLSLHDTKQLSERVIHKTAYTITEEGLANSSARLLPAGTVAFSRTASVGHCVILGCEMATSQDFANYVCGNRLHNGFLMQMFRWIQHVWKSLAGGSTHQTIYMPDFKQLQILLPPIEEQRRIAAIAGGVDDAIEAVIARLRPVKSLKKALMQDLLTGKVRVKVN